MYRGFNLKLNSSKFSKYESTGRTHYNSALKIWRGHLDKYIRNGAIDGGKLQNDWFQQQPADVFISHSHDDLNTANALAGWLKEKFNLNSFIDSAVWGHANDLQLMLDEEYSKISLGRYSYDSTRRASAHVHMMLCGALTSMLNRAECVIFLNTPSSIVAEKTIKDQTKSLTASPWIYFELITSKFIEKERSTLSLESASMQESLQRSTTARRMNVHHDAEIDHLTDLDANDLLTWESCDETGHAALTFLYDTFPE